MPIPSRYERLLPPTPLARKLSLQSILFATGQGMFLTGSAVFFTVLVGLTAAQVGLGLTIGGVASFLLAVPSGRLADRVGPKRLWVLSSFAQAGLFCVWPLINGLAEFLVMIVVLEVVGTAGYTAFSAYTIDVFPRQERVRSQAYMRAALNLGFTLGALLGGLALAFNSDRVIEIVPLVTAVIMLGNAVFVTRLPDAAHDDVPTPPEEQALSSGALRNRGFLVLNFFDGVLHTNQVLLNVVIPLWLVEETDAPRVLLAWLFGTNTVLAVLLQVRAARGVDSVSSSLRAARVCAGFFVLSCLIVLVTHDTIGWTTILLVWVGHVTVTGAELFQSAAHWGFMSELSDPDRRGEYQGAATLGRTLGSVWAPAVYTFLAIQWGTPGWLVIAAIAVVAAVGMGPSARAAERYLVRDHAPAAGSIPA